MKTHLASHFGMCFGVRDAIKATKTLATSAPTTVLGELVHNPIVVQELSSLGVRNSNLDSANPASTKDVVITAHGASNRDRLHWQEKGHRLTDTTCPLVNKAHQALAKLVSSDHHPVVIGQSGHIEVRGLVGDFPDATVVETPNDISAIPDTDRIGIISQTTQPIGHVSQMVELIRAARPNSKITFEDTVCQPTKNRQQALHDLCAICDLIVVIGGTNSNNTRQLVLKVQALGKVARHIQSRDDLDPSWFANTKDVGITAGTSTLPKTVFAVREAIEEIAQTLPLKKSGAALTPTGS